MSSWAPGRQRSYREKSATMVGVLTTVTTRPPLRRDHQLHTLSLMDGKNADTESKIFRHWHFSMYKTQQLESVVPSNRWSALLSSHRDFSKIPRGAEGGIEPCWSE